jgi:hypothetical protein
MCPGVSIHDNRVYGYTVDCENQLVVLHTVSRDSNPSQLTDVIFRGVFAHHFEHVLRGGGEKPLPIRLSYAPSSPP